MATQDTDHGRGGKNPSVPCSDTQQPSHQITTPESQPKKHGVGGGASSSDVRWGLCAPRQTGQNSTETSGSSNDCTKAINKTTYCTGPRLRKVIRTSATALHHTVGDAELGEGGGPGSPDQAAKVESQPQYSRSFFFFSSAGAPFLGVACAQGQVASPVGPPNSNGGWCYLLGASLLWKPSCGKPPSCEWERGGQNIRALGFPGHAGTSDSDG